MASVVKYNIVNGNAEADTPLESALQTYGENYEERVIHRNFLAGDIGAAAGQTRDATNPAAGVPTGCLVTQFKGALIKDVQCDIYRPTTVNGRTFNVKISSNIGPRAVFDPITKISSLYILDQGVDAGEVDDGDFGLFTIFLGNS